MQDKIMHSDRIKFGLLICVVSAKFIYAFIEKDNVTYLNFAQLYSVLGIVVIRFVDQEQTIKCD